MIIDFNIKIMEVIYRVVNGLYPFDKEKDSEQIQA